MKKSVKLQSRMRVIAGVFLLFIMVTAGLLSEPLSIVGRADSTGRVTAPSGAKIRAEASTTSESVGSAEADSEWSVKGQVTASDGYTWYQVSVDGRTGYIRSDLMTITDGSTPASVGGSTTTTPAAGGSTPTTSTPDEVLVAVTEVEPVSASVYGSSPVRVRQNASTTSRIVATAQGGAALTVTGTATGTDGNEWRRVKFTSGSSEVEGFIRADYVTLSGELTPAGTGETPTVEPQPDVETPTVPEDTKDWDTFYEGDKWHLYDNVENKSYDIEQIFESVSTNVNTLNDMLSKNKTQQIIIVILIILLIGLAGVISFLIFKLRDMADSAYFNEVERETTRRRTADRPVERSQGGQRTSGGQRPAGQRPAGSGSGTGNGQRPAGQRPAGNSNGNGQRPAGQRPAGTGSGAGNGQRPAGSGNGNGNGQRPAGGNGQRAAGSGSGTGNGQRPAGSGNGNERRQSGRRPSDDYEPVQPRQERMQESGSGQEDAYESSAQETPSGQTRAKGGWKSKNFINDDEFEFQFLDWEEDHK
ncbi:MAG: SH3 domain-containing protein [Clostridium sp.]|nr:SH3 domain-containing protein [Acetatifactor muris]MCM1526147.1 SH3 domain-containing protein [Bacteroides sp.]MCM1562705.1 SH3 domain-containing protein [Clostridium sp.]